MVDKLKPCPFCGGEAEVVFELNGTATVECIGCGALVDGIERWNRRTERTCHMVEKPDGYGSYDDVCSECGAFDSGTPYCWNCGAKVVE